MNSTFTQLEPEKIITFPQPIQWETLKDHEFYSFTVLNYNYIFLRRVRIKEVEIVEREIFTNKLVEAAKMDWNEVKGEVEELLRSYEIPAEYVEQVISEVKKRVKSKLQELPDEDWLTEILSKLYIRIAYEMLSV
jgi:signal recognition particle GTPase